MKVTGWIQSTLIVVFILAQAPSLQLCSFSAVWLLESTKSHTEVPGVLSAVPNPSEGISSSSCTISECTVVFKYLEQNHCHKVSLLAMKRICMSFCFIGCLAFFHTDRPYQLFSVPANSLPLTTPSLWADKHSLFLWLRNVYCGCFRDNSFSSECLAWQKPTFSLEIRCWGPFEADGFSCSLSSACWDVLVWYYYIFFSLFLLFPTVPCINPEKSFVSCYSLNSLSSTWLHIEC